MRNILILALVLGLLHGTLIADGPPMDEEGKVTTDFVTLTLTDTQLQQAGATRWIELTKDQRAKIKKAEGPDLRLLELITPHYDDCTCDMPAYAIWNKEKSVDFPIYRDSDERNMLSWSEVVKKAHPAVFLIDLRGKIYNRNVLLKEGALEKQIEKLKKGSSVFIERPPFVNEKVVKSALVAEKMIRSIAEKQEREVYPGKLLISELAIPEGYREATKADFAKIDARFIKDGLPTKVTADFNGDRKKDVVMLLPEKNGTGWALFVFYYDKQNEVSVVKLDETKQKVPTINMGINFEPRGSIRTACGKGYWECKPDEPEVLDLKLPGIRYFNFEGAASVFYWSKDYWMFKREWISD